MEPMGHNNCRSPPTAGGKPVSASTINGRQGQPKVLGARPAPDSCGSISTVLPEVKRISPNVSSGECALPKATPIRRSRRSAQSLDSTGGLWYSLGHLGARSYVRSVISVKMALRLSDLRPTRNNTNGGRQTLTNRSSGHNHRSGYDPLLRKKENASHEHRAFPVSSRMPRLEIC